MAIKFVDNFSIEGETVLTLKPGILLGEACDIAIIFATSSSSLTTVGNSREKRNLFAFPINMLLLILFLLLIKSYKN